MKKKEEGPVKGPEAFGRLHRMMWTFAANKYAHRGKWSYEACEGYLSEWVSHNCAPRTRKVLRKYKYNTYAIAGCKEEFNVEKAKGLGSTLKFIAKTSVVLTAMRRDYISREVFK